MEKAKELLTGTNMKIVNISERWVIQMFHILYRASGSTLV